MLRRPGRGTAGNRHRRPDRFRLNGDRGPASGQPRHGITCHPALLDAQQSCLQHANPFLTLAKLSLQKTHLAGKAHPFVLQACDLSIALTNEIDHGEHFGAQLRAGRRGCGLIRLRRLLTCLGRSPTRRHKRQPRQIRARN